MTSIRQSLYLRNYSIAQHISCMIPFLFGGNLRICHLFLDYFTRENLGYKERKQKDFHVECHIPFHVKKNVKRRCSCDDVVLKIQPETSYTYFKTDWRPTT